MLVRLAFLCLAMELIAQVCGDSSGGSSGTCPLCDVSTCDNETVLQESCPGVQLVNDPCGCCKQCGREFNESCGGAYGYLGKCVPKLKCTVDPSVYLTGVNISGICTSELHLCCIARHVITDCIGESCTSVIAKKIGSSEL